MKITILHDEQGQIIATSQVGDLQRAGSMFAKVGMIARRGQRLLETELTGDLHELSLQDLHKQYRVDPQSSRIVKKQ
jgi:hypothetical protein